MARSNTLPYPASPEDVPDDLTEYPRSYVTQEWMLLACLFLFLLLYFTMVIVSGFLAIWLAIQVARWPLLAIVGSMMSGIIFAFLVKGFFKKNEIEKELQLELKESEHPTLFAFIRQVCEETGAEEPRKMFVSADVNAAVITRTSLINLFVPPKKDMLLGLGLVNCLNLSEFKAVVAHEFGHFTQGGFVSAYTNVLQRIIDDLVSRRDPLDDVTGNPKDISDMHQAMNRILHWSQNAIRIPLDCILYLFQSRWDQAIRQREFHADLVAASIAGSNAIVHGLLRIRFGVDTLDFAMKELIKAADNKRFTSDLYYHQHAAADILRNQKKDPQLGKPPKLDGILDGEKVQVFNPDDTGDCHPSNYDREENVKARFVVAPMDERTPWILFDSAIDLRERLTYKFYRMSAKVPKGTELTDPRQIQKFIDDEHAETTYDARYEGVYDDRMIDTGDIDELNELIQKEPWTDERLATVYRKLYADVDGRAETRKDISKELDEVQGKAGGKRGRKIKRLVKELEEKLDKCDEWFHSLDRRAYLVFVQMAYRVNNEIYYELINRYRFHMAIQSMYKMARYHQGRSHFFFELCASGQPVAQDDFIELMHVLREARSALKKVLREARELDMPAMKNFEEGDRLGDFLLSEDLIKELPESYVKGKWVDKLLRQLDQVRAKSARLHFKSLGGILRYQEDIAEKFLAKSRPIVVISPQ